MMLLILVIVIGLVVWALRLMERAIDGQEFSLMLAGFLVASSAAAMVAVYFLMGHYMVFMADAAHSQPLSESAWLDQTGQIPTWLVQVDSFKP
ncbi:MAG: hypothetical protein QNJ46_29215 [Leptolyngbyaceae cyanobacterium MO_188.B28]|nr:hypothetical protein [Leptolyngbyaceae cyanobacterium MO_188.B28]